MYPPTLGKHAPYEAVLPFFVCVFTALLAPVVNAFGRLADGAFACLPAIVPPTLAAAYRLGIEPRPSGLEAEALPLRHRYMRVRPETRPQWEAQESNLYSIKAPVLQTGRVNHYPCCPEFWPKCTLGTSSPSGLPCGRSSTVARSLRIAGPFCSPLLGRG